MKKEILRLLRESEGYVSGQTICRKLSVSRTAVWKVIGQLKAEGYRIEAVQNKGYHLTETPDLLTREEISSRLHTSWAARTVIALDEVDSTNNEAKRIAESGGAHGTLVIAEQQTAGKGRRGRGWDSPSGTGIWMTLLLKPQFPPSQAAMLTLVAAMAVADGIKTVTGIENLGVKWPNDIVVGGKKVVGILTEMSTEPDYINHIVVGIGINVNGTSFPEEIRDRATSLLLESGERFSRADIVARIWEAFEGYYEKFLKTNDLTLLKEAYEQMLLNKDQVVCVLAPQGSYKGIARGIDPTGELIVERLPDDMQEEPSEEALRMLREAAPDEQRFVRVDSGEVSVRGIYGYV